MIIRIITLLVTITLAHVAYAQTLENTKTEIVTSEENENPFDDTPTFQEKDFTTGVKLQALNKITARTSPLFVKLNETATFGNIEIKLHRCWHAPLEEMPESKALIEVWEDIPGENKKQLFLGWMFASSPALSAMDHAVYDLNVVECTNNVMFTTQAAKNTDAKPTELEEKLNNDMENVVGTTEAAEE